MTKETTERDDVSELSTDCEARILRVVLQRWFQMEAGPSAKFVERWSQLRRGNGRLEAVNELLKNAFEEEASKNAAAVRWQVLEAMDAYQVEGAGEDPESFLERKAKEKAMPPPRRERGERARLPSWGKPPSYRWVTAGVLLLMTVMMIVFGPSLFEDRSFLAGREQFDATHHFQAEVEDLSRIRELEELVKSDLKEIESRLREIYERTAVGTAVGRPGYFGLAATLDSAELKEGREDYESAWAILTELDATYRHLLEWRGAPPLVVPVEVSEPVTKGGTIFGGGRIECEAVLGVIELPSLRSWLPWGILDLSPAAMDGILEEMVGRPDLLNRLKMTKEQASKLVKDRVAIRYFPATKQIGIKADGATEKESLELLHGVRESFKARYEEREFRRREFAARALGNEQRAQEDYVGERWKLLMTILQVIGIDGPPAPPEQGVMVALEKRKFRARMDLRKLQVLKGEELAEFIGELQGRRGVEEEPGD